MKKDESIIVEWNSQTNATNSTRQVLINFLKILFSLAFPVYFLWINIYSRLALDDFGFMNNLSEKSVFDLVKKMYMVFEGGFLGLTIDLYMYQIPLYEYFIVFLILNYFSFWYFLLSLWKVYKIEMSMADTFLISSILISLSYFISPNIQELWHWHGNMIYQTMIIYMLFSLSFLMRKKMVLATLFLMMVMHSRITWALISLGFFGLYFIFDYYSNKKINRALLWMGVILSITILLNILAPGNWNRKEALFTIKNATPDHVQFFPAMKNIFYTFYIVKIPYLIIFLLPLGFLLKNEFVEKIKLKKILIFIPALLLVLLTVVHGVLMYFAVGSFFYQPRVWVVNSLLFIFVGAYYILIAVYCFRKKYQNSLGNPIINNGLVVVFLIFQIYFFAKTFYVNLPIAQNYAKEFDNRAEITLHSNIKEGEILVLKPLPPSGVLMSWGLATGNDIYCSWHNVSYAKYYKLKGRIIVSDEDSSNVK